MKVSGKTIHVRANNRDIYDKLCNLSYFEKFLPEQIKDWEAGEDYCQFAIPGVATMRLTIAERSESKIVYTAGNDKNIPVNITIFMDGQGEGTDLHADIDAEIPIFLSAMVKTPLQNLVDMIADRVKTETEK